MRNITPHFNNSFNTGNHHHLAAIRNQELVRMAGEDSLQECISRDIVHKSICNHQIKIELNAINDASIYMIHQFKAYQACTMGDKQHGLVSWLILMVGEYLDSGGLIEWKESEVFDNIKIAKFKKFGFFWTLNQRKIARGSNCPINLTSIKLLESEENSRVDPKCSQLNITAHVINRISTRVLDMFINQGLMAGMNIVEFITDGYKKSKFVSKRGNETKRICQNINFITHKQLNGSNTLVTITL